jgi:hypothetical protein
LATALAGQVRRRRRPIGFGDPTSEVLDLLPSAVVAA